MIDALHAASRWVEEVATRHQHTVEAVNATATTLAVVVALISARIAYKSSQPRVKATVRVENVIVNASIYAQTFTFVTLKISNRGGARVRFQMTMFSWKAFFGRGYLLVPRPIDNGVSQIFPYRQYPIEIDPHTSETVFLDTIEAFHQFSAPRLRGRRLIPRWMAAWLLKAYVTTDGGKRFRVKISADLRRDIADHMTQMPSTESSPSHTLTDNSSGQ